MVRFTKVSTKVLALQAKSLPRMLIITFA